MMEPISETQNFQVNKVPGSREIQAKLDSGFNLQAFGVGGRIIFLL